jgi:RNA polymerase sigma-B factor
VTDTKGATSDRDRDRGAELERFRAYRAAPTESERAALVETFQWVARHCARRFADRGEPFDDLQQVAMLGVLKAVDRFDPDVGSSFVSFALPTVLGELRRHFRDHTWAVRVPRRLKDLHVEVGSTAEFLSSENGRPPTPDQIADHLGIPVEDVLEALDAGAAYRSSPLNVSGEHDEEMGTGQVFGEVDPELARTDDRVVLGEAIAELPPRERKILELRFAQGLSQSEIAEVVGVSQVHVSRLLRSSIRMLQAHLGHSEHGDDGEDAAAVDGAGPERDGSAAS